MADFRQNSPDIRTSNSTFSFTPDNGTAVSTLGTGITNAFSGYLEGKQNEALRRQRARSLELSELANDRAARSEQREISEYEVTLQERRVQDAVTSIVVDSTVSNAFNILGRNGVDMSTFRNPEEYSPDEAKALEQATQTAERLRSLSSGSGRGVQQLGTRLLVEQQMLTRRFPAMSAEIEAAFKTNTGKTIVERGNEITEMAQHDELEREQNFRKLIEKFRADYGLPHDRYNDSQVLEYGQKYMANQRSIDAYTNRGRIASANSAIRQDSAERGLQEVGGAMLNTMGVNLSRLWSLVDKAGGPSGLGQAQLATYLVQGRGIINNNRAALLQGGVPPEKVNAFLKGAEDQLDIFTNYANGSMGRDSAKAALESFMAAIDYNILSAPVPGQPGVVFGELAARANFVQDIAGNLSEQGKMRLETSMRPTLNAAFGVLSGIDGGGALPGTGAGILPPAQARAAARDVGAFADITLTNVATLPPGAPAPRLTAGRSLANVPNFLRANINAGPGIDSKITAINQAMVSLSANSSTTDIRVIEPWIRGAADINQAGTYFIDPKVLPHIRKLIPDYFRRAIVAMNADFDAMTPSAAAQMGDVSLGGHNPFDPLTPANQRNAFFGGGAGHGIDVVEAADGGVTFRVSASVPASQRANAAQVAATFNTKYAPHIRNVVRSYAHIYQGDQDYRTALSQVMIQGAALGNAFTNDEIYTQAAARMMQETPGLTMSEALNMVKQADK